MNADVAALLLLLVDVVTLPPAAPPRLQPLNTRAVPLATEDVRALVWVSKFWGMQIGWGLRVQGLGFRV